MKRSADGAPHGDSGWLDTKVLQSTKVEFLAYRTKLIQFVLLSLASVVLAFGCDTQHEEQVDPGPSREATMTVVAFAGGNETVVDLASLGVGDGPFRMITQVSTVELDESRLVVRHPEPVDETLLVAAEDGEGVPDTVSIWHRVFAAEAGTPAYPLRIAQSRHLVDAEGRVVQFHGDTPWSLVVQLTSEERETYFSTRREQGVNAILFNLIEHKFGDFNPDPWTNQKGENPFQAQLGSGAFDFTTPNEPYWAEVDVVLTEARAAGLTCLVVPAYVGWMQGEEGWAAEIAANGPDRMRNYGVFLGNRYGALDHVIWVMGGDWGPTSDRFDLTDEINALAEGIRSADRQHFMTAHGGQQSAIDAYNEPWLDLNNTYKYGGDIGSQLQVDFKRRRNGAPIPFFFIEGVYENTWDSTPQVLRWQIYTALLGGAFGHFYGATPVWTFDAASGRDFADDQTVQWREALHFEAAEDLRHVRRLTRVRPMHVLQPDLDGRIVVEGGGRLGHPDYVSAASGEGIGIVYTPTAHRLTVDLAALNIAGDVRAAWYNPREGTHRLDRIISGTGNESFVPPADGDWVLLLDDARFNLPLPGASQGG